jgi:transcriptional regulator with XRE-family HTH domain
MGLSIVFGVKSEKISENICVIPIDNAVPSMLPYWQMDDVQSLLAKLIAKGWTKASIADRLGVTTNAVEKWQAGDRNISQSRLILLRQLLPVKRIPKKRRYTKGDRRNQSPSDKNEGEQQQDVIIRISSAREK